MYNGLEVRKVAVPLGVIAVVYEARPNVTIDAAALCLKSGNAIVLRGSSVAAHSNAVLGAGRARRDRRGRHPGGRDLDRHRRRPRRAARARHPGGRDRPDHPARRRGSEGRAEGGRDRPGDLRRRRQLPRLRRRRRRPRHGRSDRRSTRRSSAPASATPPRRCSCTATSPTTSCRASSRRMNDEGVRAARRRPHAVAGRGRRRRGARSRPSATGTDEYLDLILAVSVVDSLDEAIEHINQSRHRPLRGDRHAQRAVGRRLHDAASTPPAVYVNASTRFTDGGEFGFGAEIGNSTQKLARARPDRPARAVHLQVRRARRRAGARLAPPPTVMRIGLLGGTFNPPHHGHLICAAGGAHPARPRRVLMIPVAHPAAPRARPRAGRLAGPAPADVPAGGRGADRARSQRGRDRPRRHVLHRRYLGTIGDGFTKRRFDFDRRCRPGDVVRQLARARANRRTGHRGRGRARRARRG